jgi:hypothetical protein
MIPPFNTLRQGAVKASKRYVGTLLALDPGETTGWAIFESTVEDVQMKGCGQVKTWPLEIGLNLIDPLVRKLSDLPFTVVLESYRVYEWKSDSHSWSDVPTLQVIGAIKTLCIQRRMPYYEQTAQVAKQFVTDEKLETWGFYKPGLRHARDAMRHGCYFHLFRDKIKHAYPVDTCRR